MVAVAELLPRREGRGRRRGRCLSVSGIVGEDEVGTGGGGADELEKEEEKSCEW